MMAIDEIRIDYAELIEGEENDPPAYVCGVCEDSWSVGATEQHEDWCPIAQLHELRHDLSREQRGKIREIAEITEAIRERAALLKGVEMDVGEELERVAVALDSRLAAAKREAERSAGPSLDKPSEAVYIAVDRDKCVMAVYANKSDASARVGKGGAVSVESWIVHRHRPDEAPPADMSDTKRYDEESIAINPHYPECWEQEIRAVQEIADIALRRLAAPDGTVVAGGPKRPEYEPKTPAQRLSYLIEECGEVLVPLAIAIGRVLAAAGKSMRWGYESFNPELPEDQRETNAAWLARELLDLDAAIARVRSDITKGA
jgi:hypothetical protein